MSAVSLAEIDALAAQDRGRPPRRLFPAGPRPSVGGVPVPTTTSPRPGRTDGRREGIPEPLRGDRRLEREVRHRGDRLDPIPARGRRGGSCCPSSGSSSSRKVPSRSIRWSRAPPSARSPVSSFASTICSGPRRTRSAPHREAPASTSAGSEGQSRKRSRHAARRRSSRSGSRSWSTFPRNGSATSSTPSTRPSSPTRGPVDSLRASGIRGAPVSRGRSTGPSPAATFPSWECGASRSSPSRPGSRRSSSPTCSAVQLRRLGAPGAGAAPSGLVRPPDGRLPPPTRRVPAPSASPSARFDVEPAAGDPALRTSVQELIAAADTRATCPLCGSTLPPGPKSNPLRELLGAGRHGLDPRAYGPVGTSRLGRFRPGPLNPRLLA